MNPNSKKRAVASNLTIAKQRQAIISAAYSWIKKSMQDKFYVEAVSIIESLISDRLESRLSFLMGQNVGFQNLGTLVDKTYAEETKNAAYGDNEIMTILKDPNNTDNYGDIERWTKRRNQVIHEIGKVEAGNFIPFDEKLEKAKEVAKKGLVLLRKLDKRITYLRRKK